MKRFKKSIYYYIFAIRWFYINRDWTNSRQKYKAFDKEWALKESSI